MAKATKKKEPKEDSLVKIEPIYDLPDYLDEEKVEAKKDKIKFGENQEVRCEKTHHHYHVFNVDHDNDIVYAEQKGQASHMPKWYDRDHFKTWVTVI